MTAESWEISFLCKDFGQLYTKGRLKLSLNFVSEYGETLPERLYFEVPTGEIWYGTYEKNSRHICGLEKLIEFYSLKQYHMLVLTYYGGPNFKMEIYNECAVEIAYPFGRHLSGINDPEKCLNTSLLNNSLNSRQLWMEKMAATLNFSAESNCPGLLRIQIEKEHFIPATNYKVISLRDAEKLHASENLKSLQLGFQNFIWTIGLTFKEDNILFDNGWYEFITAAQLREGDLCILSEAEYPCSFKVAVIHKHLLLQWSTHYDSAQFFQRFKWFKIIKESCLETGEMEIPLLFASKFKSQFTNKVDLHIPDGNLFKAVLSKSKSSIKGLNELIDKYEIYSECVMIFDYNGKSSFNVTLFDSTGVDLLKEINGEYISDIVRDLALNNDEEVEDNAAEQNQEFFITLKSSHVEQRGHGVYCPTHMFNIFQNWMPGTLVTLVFQGVETTVHVQRRDRSCRFGKGWDEFTRKHHFDEGNVLQFIYHDLLTFHVTRIA